MAQADYILGLDYGEKRIGVAVAHAIARLPRQLTTLTNSPSVMTEIQEIVDREGVGLIVVGLPRSMDGQVHAQAERAQNFADEIAAHISVPVELADETLTSVQAEQILAERTPGKPVPKEAIDSMSATLILERYFEEHQTGSVA
jgi:putative Holliday junction resolvase